MWLWLWSALAFAQDGPVGEARWVVADIEASRFVNTDAHTLSLKAQDKVEIVHEKDGRLRIVKEGRYAWVAPEALTAEAPEVDVSSSPLLDNPALTTPIQIPGLDVQLGGSK